MKITCIQSSPGSLFRAFSGAIVLNCIIVLSLITTQAAAQDRNAWRIGIQLGSSANLSKYSGHMPIADARFQQKIFPAHNVSLSARCDLNEHLMLLTGIGFTDLGFVYSISEDHTLAQAKVKTTDLKTDVVALELPVTLFYKFSPNRRQNKWLAGLGFAATLTEKQSATKDLTFNAVENAGNYLSSRLVANGGAALLLRMSIGREKTFHNGSLLQASFLMNLGFKSMASSTVDYTIDSQKYTHTFSNTGTSVGFRLAYFMKPFGGI